MPSNLPPSDFFRSPAKIMVPATERKPSVEFFVEPSLRERIAMLPWDHPIESWRSMGVRHYDIKRGMGRHPVVFVESEGLRLVVKELGYEVSRREVANYAEMLRRGIHTLVPVGCVLRHEAPIAVDTRIGVQYQEYLVGHTVTLLSENVVPDSLLYRRAFRFENRKRIWDAIVRLFVEMHRNGVYWGDASLANTLIRFLRVEIPYVGRRTQLKAYLADAETVEIRPTLPDSMRLADVNFFLESMDWINEDLRASGILREPMSTEQDKRYILETYERSWSVDRTAREFERLTKLNVEQVLGTVERPEYLETLRRHIDEHKWYLSERRRTDVSYSDASRDWLQTVFIPICDLFRDEGMLDYLPGKTASELYVEIMTNKYFLSREAGRDVGMLRAMHDYAERFGAAPKPMPFWLDLAEKMLKILGWKEEQVLIV